MANCRSLHGAIVAANVIAAAALCGNAAAAQSDGAGLYLYRISSARADGALDELGNSVHADLYVDDPIALSTHLSAQTNISVIETSNEWVRVSAGVGETLTGEPTVKHLAETFVVDYQQPPVTEILSVLHAEYGEFASIEILANFVDSVIENKTYRRSFDVASQVAVSRAGDCTEHSVLLAAVARAAGRPARIVIGVMLVERDAALVAFGHAWTEIHDGDDWRIADGTRPSLRMPDASLRYLPILMLEDEGPGYAMQLLNLAVLQPTRIELKRAVEGEAGEVG